MKVSLSGVVIKSFPYQTMPIYTNIRNLEIDYYIFMSSLAKCKVKVLVTRFLDFLQYKVSQFSTHKLNYTYSLCFH